MPAIPRDGDLVPTGPRPDVGNAYLMHPFFIVIFMYGAVQSLHSFNLQMFNIKNVGFKKIHFCYEFLDNTS